MRATCLSNCESDYIVARQVPYGYGYQYVYVSAEEAWTDGRLDTPVVDLDADEVWRLDFGAPIDALIIGQANFVSVPAGGDGLARGVHSLDVDSGSGWITLVASAFTSTGDPIVTVYYSDGGGLKSQAYETWAATLPLPRVESILVRGSTAGTHLASTTGFAFIPEPGSGALLALALFAASLLRRWR
jgi:hypothetical protein